MIKLSAEIDTGDVLDEVKARCSYATYAHVGAEK